MIWYKLKIFLRSCDQNKNLSYEDISKTSQQSRESTCGQLFWGLAVRLLACVRLGTLRKSRDRCTKIWNTYFDKRDFITWRLPPPLLLCARSWETNNRRQWRSAPSRCAAFVLWVLLLRGLTMKDASFPLSNAQKCGTIDRFTCSTRDQLRGIWGGRRTGGEWNSSASTSELGQPPLECYYF